MLNDVGWIFFLIGAQICSCHGSVYTFYVLFDMYKCDVFVSFDVSCVFVVVGSSFFLLSGNCMRVERVFGIIFCPMREVSGVCVCIGSMFVLSCRC